MIRMHFMRAERFLHRLGLFSICLGLAATVFSEAHAAGPRCVAWPGEISPLPTVDHEDSLRSEWASRRAEELAALARTVEKSNSSEAYRVWQHVLCLDSENAAARKAVATISLVQVHQPQVLQVAAEPTVERVARVEDAFANLAQPIRVGPQRAVEVAQSVPEPSDRATDDVDRKLGQASALVREARFREALALAKEVQAQLQGKRGEPGTSVRFVRAAVLAATAEVALGRKLEARASFERALEMQPGLELDAATTSPKVIRVFRGAKVLRGQE